MFFTATKAQERHTYIIASRLYWEGPVVPLERSRTVMSTLPNLIAWKSRFRCPLYVSSRCVGDSQFIPTFIPSGPGGPSENAKIIVGGFLFVAQFRYTVV